MPDSVLHFNGEWRSYQKRILDDLDFHLRDDKLHVVAAPGAGKTTLGIEVISRLNRPSLILCPTNTIKNQWKERIRTSFLQEKDYGIVSTDIRKPGYLTVITYQALLAAFCGFDEEAEDNRPEDEERTEKEYTITASRRFRMDKAEDIIGILKSSEVSLLCFDEAHHLRKEWWKALTYLDEHLKPDQTLALTATPPYDADLNEWKRYQALCGDIDAVISIPELVKNGDLCPHQDFIHFSQLHQRERELLENHRQNVNIMLEKLREDKRLQDLLAGMRFLQAEDEDTEAILDDPEFYVSIASLLNDNGYTIPSRFLGLFDASPSEIPRFDIKQATVFLNGFLHAEKEEWKDLESIRSEYFSQAKRTGLTDGKRFVLDGNEKFCRQIAGSIGKLDSIVSIVDLESRLLKEDLRMVILADFIRMNDLDCSTLGVVPIWRKLKDKFQGNISLGVLCGSLILLPKNTVKRLQGLISGNGIALDSITLDHFGGDGNYVRIVPKEGIRNHIVRLVTEMFNAGVLTVLVGTQALLGEGWDAPSINSLILSSTVSSYMLSNQMRGRAIRIDRNHPDKVSNIWHLATYDTKFGNYSFDLEQLATRFEGYEAPSYDGDHEIVSGIERVLMPNPLGVPETNIALAKNRDLTRRWWKDALYTGYGNTPPIGLSTGVQAEALTVKSLRYTGYWYYIWLLLPVAMLLFYLPNPVRGIGLTVIALLVGIIVWHFIRTGSVTGVMKQIAIVILETLSDQGLIKTSIKQVGLKVHEEKGELFVICANLPADENNLFIQSLQEFLDPVENPRYLLVRHTRFLKKIRQTDYFAIPSAISPNKKGVEIFKGLWKLYIGDCDIIYTRSAEGRRVLLKARKYAFSAVKKKASKRLSKWQ
ncbi:MAG: DEAD/DEAH box helicase family protein [Bacteroidales bacterium]|nr:DEAD/DEAH box helicase family protein [Bacteroidales bacterium]